MFTRRWFSVILAIGVGLLSGFSAGQSSSPPQQPQQEHSMAQDMNMEDMHHEEVNRHGDMAMGFSHMKSTHHFRLSRSGGSIEVQANDPADKVSRDQIRRHLEQLPKDFKAGNFSAPMETHGRVPPGVPTMQQLKSEITYKYVRTDLGGKVLISTANPKALEAIHEFLRFQIQDHKTGDPLTPTK
jgi:hypothetical protein